MRTLPPLGQLRAFEAVARHSSFRKAAQELGVTPTAISHQIRLLEDFCRRPLFRRRPRPVTLTAAGANLFPVVREGFDAVANAVSTIREDRRQAPLRVTTTNGFASRWLIPRLPGWRSAYPGIRLEVLGTDRLVDLRSGDADVAIRYMEAPPPDLVSYELFRDAYVLVVSPDLISGTTAAPAREGLAALSLVESVWPDSYEASRTWEKWLAMARAEIPDLPAIGAAGTVSFTEELHAIQALIAGQGIGICSDVLVRSELESGALVKAVDFEMPGLGFYLVHLPHHSRQSLIDTFLSWVRSTD